MEIRMAYPNEINRIMEIIQDGKDSLAAVSYTHLLIFLNFENKRKLLKAFEIILKIKYNKTNKSIGELVMAVKDFMTRKVVYICLLYTSRCV